MRRLLTSAYAFMNGFGARATQLWQTAVCLARRLKLVGKNWAAGEKREDPSSGRREEALITPPLRGRCTLTGRSEPPHVGCYNDPHFTPALEASSGSTWLSARLIA